jgi:hypothetical protein
MAPQAYPNLKHMNSLHNLAPYYTDICLKLSSHLRVGLSSILSALGFVEDTFWIWTLFIGSIVNKWTRFVKCEYKIGNECTM